MRYLPTGQQMREADFYTIEQMGMPSLVLMERAALQVVEAMEREALDMKRVMVVCGSGNNGGDGYAVARLLHLKGYSVDIYFAGNEASRSPENQKQREIADAYQVPEVNSFDDQEYSVIVDALFGTGLKRDITGHFQEVLEKVNHMSGRKVAIDIPSGIHDATGGVMGVAFQADITVALAFEKRGMALHPGRDYAGKIVVADIGIMPDAISRTNELTYTYDRNDLTLRFPKRMSNSHKGTHGKVLMIVGSKGMSGAAYLSAKAAYETGAGLVRIYTHEDNRVVLQKQLPEAMITTYHTFDEKEMEPLLAWADVVCIGCGLGKDIIAEKLVEYTLQHTEGPCLVDADALNLLSEHMEWLDNAKCDLILTPHMKEMTRLLHCDMGALIQDRIWQLTKLTERYPIICALKDARTLVAKKGEDIYINLSGNESMAKGGSGDVLAGVITGLLAQHVAAYEATCLGVYLHGLAGDAAKEEKGVYSVLASDIIEGISKVLKDI